MSYDVSMVFDINGKRYRPVEVGNMTENIRGMLDAAFGDTYWCDVIEGKTGRDAFPILKSATEAMLADPAKYEALAPKNGVGNYYGVMNFLRLIRQCAEENPDLIIEIDR